MDTAVSLAITPLSVESMQLSPAGFYETPLPLWALSWSLYIEDTLD